MSELWSYLRAVLHYFEAVGLVLKNDQWEWVFIGFAIYWLGRRR